jgi:tetratricopeptide (TPR) repeat protein
VSRFARLLLAVAAAGTVAAGPSRPRVDEEAIAEARRPAPPGRFASAAAISHYLAARRAALRGDAPAAAEELRLAVAHDPESGELRVSLASALAIAGRLGDAEAEARRALELDRDGAAAVDAHVLLAKIHASRHERERALLALRQAVRIESARAERGDGADPEAWRLLAELYLEAGDDAAAARVLDDAAARIPGEALGFREMGRGLVDRRELPKAERALRRAIEIDPADADARRLLGRTYEALRRDADAREAYVAALRLEPDDPDTLLALGGIALRAEDFAGAREWYTRHLRAVGDGPDARLRIAFAWLDAGRGEEALAVAREGIAESGPEPRLKLAEGLALQDLRRWTEAAAALGAVKPDAGDLWITARLSQAYALSRAGRHAEADRALDEPLAARPRDVRLVTMRAHVLLRAGKGPQAVALLRRAIAEHERAGDPAALPELTEALADGLSRSGKPDEAVEALRSALAKRPRDEALIYALGAAYDEAGNSDAAVAQMRALLALNPDHADALNFVGYVYADRNVHLDEAERFVRRALDLKPRSAHILDSLGWLHYRKGEYVRAVEVLERADAIAGPEPTILDHLGDAYRAAARPGDAGGAYRRALKSLGDESPATQVKLRASLERKLKELAAGEARPVAR